MAVGVDLPFPIASVAWAFEAEEGVEERTEQAYHLFEVSARFVGAVLFSGLTADREIHVATRRSWQGTARPSQVLLRPTLGTWVAFDVALAKATRRLIAEDAVRAASVFGLASAARLEPLTSRPLGSALAEALRLRNEWRGHTAPVGASERSRRLSVLDELVARVIDLLRSSFDRWYLYKARECRIGSGRYTFNADWLAGPHPRFRRAPITLDHQMDEGQLFMHDAGVSRAMTLAPLVRVYETPDSRDAVYFIDRISGDQARWLSYHYEPRPERMEPVDEQLRRFIMSLDSEESILEDPLLTIEARHQSPEAIASDSQQPDYVAAAHRRPRPLEVMERRMLSLDSGGVEVRTDSGREYWSREGLFGWLEDWGAGTRIMADVALEDAPYLPGTLLIDMAVSALGRPATQLPAENAGSFEAGALLLAVALGNRLRWSRDDRRLLEMFRDSRSASGADPSLVGWGIREEEVPSYTRSEWRTWWSSVLKRSAALEADEPRPATGPVQLVQLRDGIRLEVRSKTAGVFVGVVVEGSQRTLDAWLNSRSRIESKADVPLAWLQEVRRLQIVGCATRSPSHSDEGASEVGRWSATLMRAVDNL